MTDKHAGLINRLSYGCRDIETGDPLTTGFTNTRVEDVQKAITALSSPVTLAQAMQCPEVHAMKAALEEVARTPQQGMDMRHIIESRMKVARKALAPLLAMDTTNEGKANAD